jgi:hypothetical protein
MRRGEQREEPSRMRVRLIMQADQGQCIRAGTGSAESGCRFGPRERERAGSGRVISRGGIGRVKNRDEAEPTLLVPFGLQSEPS